jgi:hypothetical protein
MREPTDQGRKPAKKAVTKLPAAAKTPADKGLQLFDLRADPHEIQDLGRDRASAAQRNAMHDELLRFLASRKHRTAVSDAFILSRTNTHKVAGMFYGQW